MTVAYGKVPNQLAGRLFRNGPAYHSLGNDRFEHWFDAPGMAQRFDISSEFSIMDAILRPIATLRNLSSKEFYLRVLAPVIQVCRTVDLQTGKTPRTLILSSMQMSCWRCGKVGLRTG